METPSAPGMGWHQRGWPGGWGRGWAHRGVPNVCGVWGRTRRDSRSRCSQGTPQVHRGVQGGMQGLDSVIFGHTAGRVQCEVHRGAGLGGGRRAGGVQEGGHGQCEFHGVSRGWWRAGVHTRVSQRGNTELCKFPQDAQAGGWELMGTS